MAVPPLRSPFKFIPSPARGLRRSAHDANAVRTIHNQHHPIDYFSLGQPHGSEGDDGEEEDGDEVEGASTADEAEVLDLDAAAPISGSEIRTRLAESIQRFSESFVFRSLVRHLLSGSCVKQDLHLSACRSSLGFCRQGTSKNHIGSSH